MTEQHKQPGNQEAEKPNWVRCLEENRRRYKQMNPQPPITHEEALRMMRERYGVMEYKILKP